MENFATTKLNLGLPLQLADSQEHARMVAASGSTSSGDRGTALWDAFQEDLPPPQ